MRRREFISLISGIAATWPLAAQAQQRVLPVVGLLRSTELAELIIAAFRRGLSASGYTDGKNVTVEYSFGRRHAESMMELAADLVRKRVAAIVAIAVPVLMLLAYSKARSQAIFRLSCRPNSS